jgi:hypothetical protein
LRKPFHRKKNRDNKILERCIGKKSGDNSPGVSTPRFL